VEIKTEADSNDITECPHDDKPTTGMFGLFDAVFSAIICLCINNIHVLNCILFKHYFCLYRCRFADSFSLFLSVCTKQ